MKPLVLRRRRRWHVTSPRCRAFGIRWHSNTSHGCGCAVAENLRVAQVYARWLTVRGEEL